VYEDSEPTEILGAKIGGALKVEHKGNKLKMKEQSQFI